MLAFLSTLFLVKHLENININEAVDLGGHNPKKIYKTEEQIDESKSKFNIQVLKKMKILIPK